MVSEETVTAICCGTLVLFSLYVMCGIVWGDGK